MKYEATHSPLTIKVSFKKLLEHYKAEADNDNNLLSEKAKKILAVAEEHPELIEGIEDLSSLDAYKEQIDFITQDMFPPMLSSNEIKTIGIPFDDRIFKASTRFKDIIKRAGEDYNSSIRNIPEDQMYILQCTVILSFYYKIDVQYKKPLYYDIPDENGIIRHYRIMYNADFMELSPTENAVELNEEDIDELLDGFDDISLWKEKFPPNSWLAKGFVISNLFDVTIDNSISDLKTTLLEQTSHDTILLHKFENIFRSIFGIKNLQTGFSSYDDDANSLEKLTKNMPSFLLHEKSDDKCQNILCDNSYKTLLKDKHHFAISDVEKYDKVSNGAAPYGTLATQGFKSAILVPVAHEGELLGILELVSHKKHELNSINANKLHEVMPYITAAVVRNKTENKNTIEAVIQNECTSIHESVKWKFVKEAKKFLREKNKGSMVSFGDIAFKDVYPLYGQIDIKNSSDARNEATQRDLYTQLKLIKNIFKSAVKEGNMPIYEEYSFRISSYLQEVEENFQTSTEQNIIDFLFEEIHPALEQVKTINASLNEMVEKYVNQLNETTGMVYDCRNDYDQTVTIINKRMAKIIDEKQQSAQKMFPHFFERYKTDGVEHTMYIGKSISNGKPFSDVYLQNLKLWQLETMCFMENAYYNLKPDLKIPLDVSSLILVHNTPLSIKFRMDEKHFDVDGTYNARYEIIKKRIDKAHIRGTQDRITQPGKMTIIYSQKKDEEEYLRYIKLLQAKGILNDDVVINELEDLQGVSGLKALSAGIMYKYEDNKSPLTYNDLMKELAK
ncbi:GAF domain-containing protein [Galbibacter mesophilus]|uniref:GAF domain-containing protein n=1 Tax=Galbibacter mesophilus TaxID=379069 RepID=UPI00191E207F|nr:GAF domain-containing protein [Galbibacter mesophilus]MCM5662684.1 GAF domain-containing protein [Galbibacter mesophilus]